MYTAYNIIIYAGLTQVVEMLRLSPHMPTHDQVFLFVAGSVCVEAMKQQVQYLVSFILVKIPRLVCHGFDCYGASKTLHRADTAVIVLTLAPHEPWLCPHKERGGKQ